MSKLSQLIDSNGKPVDRRGSLEPSIKSSNSSGKSGIVNRDLSEEKKKVDDLNVFIRTEDRKRNNPLDRPNHSDDDEIRKDDDGLNYNEMDGPDYMGEGQFYDGNYNDVEYGKDDTEEDNDDNGYPYQKHQKNQSMDNLSAHKDLVVEDFDSTNNLNSSENLAKGFVKKSVKSEDQSSNKSESFGTSIMNSIRSMFGKKKVDAVDNIKRPVRMDAFEETGKKSKSFCCF